ncbi:MAG: GNAT family N-acetyltransferase [Bacteroidota bacterium]|nr:GNAT family N-acetyltransferase [Bacteroidota bacterium]
MISLNFTPFPVIETDRLILRKIRMDEQDKKDLLSLRTDPIVNRYIDRPMMTSMEEVVSLIQLILDGESKNDSINWVITLKNSDRMIGTICFWRMMKEDFRAELGYVLSPGYHRKGIMKDAIKAVLEYGFDIMKLHSVEANVNPANEASISLLEKNGFIKEAHFRENYFFEGKFLDSCIFSLLTPHS